LFEKDLLADLLAEFDRTLGPPEVRTFNMTRGETIKAYRYPPASASLSGPSHERHE
jgi:hypothetical protein